MLILRIYFPAGYKILRMVELEGEELPSCGIYPRQIDLVSID